MLNDALLAQNGRYFPCLLFLETVESGRVVDQNLSAHFGIRCSLKFCQIAKDAGLDCFETIFELISYDQINQFAAFGGFPVRYPHLV